MGNKQCCGPSEHVNESNEKPGIRKRQKPSSKKKSGKNHRHQSESLSPLSSDRLSSPFVSSEGARSTSFDMEFDGQLRSGSVVPADASQTVSTANDVFLLQTQTSSRPSGMNRKALYSIRSDDDDPPMSLHGGGQTMSTVDGPLTGGKSSTTSMSKKSKKFTFPTTDDAIPEHEHEEVLAESKRSSILASRELVDSTELIQKFEEAKALKSSASKKEPILEESHMLSQRYLVPNNSVYADTEKNMNTSVDFMKLLTKSKFDKSQVSNNVELVDSGMEFDDGADQGNVRDFVQLAQSNEIDLAAMQKRAPMFSSQIGIEQQLQSMMSQSRAKEEALIESEHLTASKVSDKAPMEKSAFDPSPVDAETNLVVPTVGRHTRNKGFFQFPVSELSASEADSEAQNPESASKLQKSNLKSRRHPSRPGLQLEISGNSKVSDKVSEGFEFEDGDSPNKEDDIEPIRVEELQTSQEIRVQQQEFRNSSLKMSSGDPLTNSLMTSEQHLQAKLLASSLITSNFDQKRFDKSQLIDSILEKNKAKYEKYQELADDGPEDDDWIPIEDLIDTLIKILSDDKKAISQVEKKEFYQYIVRVSNGLGGIRILHKIFVDQRRALIDFKNPDAVIPDEYFKICARFIPLLEIRREDNLIEMYKDMINICTPGQLEIFQHLPLDKIAKKIDYEKICNQGLFKRFSSNSSDLQSLEYEELLNIKEHCNDTVMKQYKVNKNRPWTKKISQDQMYQVFQCFSEDQIFYYEEFEFALLERRIQEVQIEKHLNESQNSLYTSAISSAKGSERSAKQRELDELLKQRRLIEEEKRKDRQIEAEMEAQQHEQEKEISNWNVHIARKFEQNILGLTSTPKGISDSKRKAQGINTKSFNHPNRPQLGESPLLLDQSTSSLRKHDEQNELGLLENPVSSSNGSAIKDLKQTPRPANFHGEAPTTELEEGDDLLAFDDEELLDNMNQLELKSPLSISESKRDDQQSQISSAIQGQMYGEDQSANSQSRRDPGELFGDDDKFGGSLSQDFKAQDSQMIEREEENMPVESSMGSGEANRKLDGYEDKEDEYVQDYSDEEDNLDQQVAPGEGGEAKIVIAKKKMTRSIFTIDEEAMEDGTVKSSIQTHGFGADFENSQIIGPEGEIESAIGGSQLLDEGHSQLEIATSQLIDTDPTKNHNSPTFGVAKTPRSTSAKKGSSVMTRRSSKVKR